MNRLLSSSLLSDNNKRFYVFAWLLSTIFGSIISWSLSSAISGVYLEYIPTKFDELRFDLAVLSLIIFAVVIPSFQWLCVIKLTGSVKESILWVPVTTLAVLISTVLVYLIILPISIMLQQFGPVGMIGFALLNPLTILPLCFGACIGLVQAVATPIGGRYRLRWIIVNALGYWTLVVVVRIIQSSHLGYLSVPAALFAGSVCYGIITGGTFGDIALEYLENNDVSNGV